MSPKEKLLFDLNFTQNELTALQGNCHRLVKLIKIPKKSGGYRLVYHPSRKLKSVQLWLKSKYFEGMKVHESASAYQKGSSIIKNAKTHQHSDFFFKIDFQNFFPSILHTDIISHFRSEKNTLGLDNKNLDELIVITKSFCFDTNSSLVMGYPTSPILANLAMYEFDNLLDANLKTIDKNIYYSRYADDIIISYSQKVFLTEIKRTFKEVIQSKNVPLLKINREKTKLFKKSSGIAAITGIRVAADGHLTIYKQTKDEIRLLLSLMGKNTLQETDKPKLKGLISFAKSADPHFYTKISRKYFKQLLELYQHN